MFRSWKIRSRKFRSQECHQAFRCDGHQHSERDASDDIYEAFNNGDATMMFILFDDTTSADETIEAVREIRKLSNEQCFVSGMSAVLVDTQDLAESVAPIYVMLAVPLGAASRADAVDGQLPGSVPVPGIDRHGHRVQPRHKPRYLAASPISLKHLRQSFSLA